MDGNRFDNVSRMFAAGISRRTTVKGAALALMGAIGLRDRAEAQVTQAQCGNKVCAKNPAVCNNGCVCCVGRNGNSRCRPPGECGPGTTVFPPCTDCAVDVCGGPSPCGENPDTGSCACSQTVQGTCACFQPICDVGPVCSAESPDCPAGFACVNSECCGESFCAALCATPVEPPISARSAPSGGAWGR